MSSKARSPTANILRSSRFFSVPRPLPLPSYGLAIGDTQSHRTSESATLPYPIQQSITTPPSSLLRGDWGLKRSLPLRSTTKTSTPLVRINAVDTREQITDFSSASDLAISLQKIQELKLPVTVSSRKYGSAGKHRQISAFEPQYDNTDPASTVSDLDDADSHLINIPDQKRRWKYEGPWVAGMTTGEFDTFVAKELKKRKKEFTSFLRERAAQQVLRDRREEAQMHGVKASTDVTDEDVAAKIRTMRNEYDLNSHLSKLIAEFLDLPDTHSVGSDFVDTYGMSKEGPPSTHPSAGMSYLRTDAFLDNHPLFGPQADHMPSEARILGGQTRFDNVGARIGVAGIVANPPKGAGGRIRSIPPLPNNNDFSEVRDRNGQTIGLATPGGNRIWVSPTRLEVDSRGRTRLESSNPSPTTVGIHTGNLVSPNLPVAPKRSPLGTSLNPQQHRVNPIESKQGRRGNKYGIGPNDGIDSTGDLMKLLSSEFLFNPDSKDD